MRRRENLSKDPMPAATAGLIDLDSCKILGPSHGVDISDCDTINRCVCVSSSLYMCILIIMEYFCQFV